MGKGKNGNGILSGEIRSLQASLGGRLCAHQGMALRDLKLLEKKSES
jgi:hypothetical protein